LLLRIVLLLARVRRQSNNGAVATLHSKNGSRADIYIGFAFDGYTAYDNIGSSLPNITMHFVPPPTIASLDAIIEFHPEQNETIPVKVRAELVAI